MKSVKNKTSGMPANKSLPSWVLKIYLNMTLFFIDYEFSITNYEFTEGVLIRNSQLIIPN